MQIDIVALLTHATIHFVIGLFLGLVVAWILISKTKKETHDAMLEVLKQKNDIIAQKDDIIAQKEKEKERQADIFSKHLADLQIANKELFSQLIKQKYTQNKAAADN